MCGNRPIPRNAVRRGWRQLCRAAGLGAVLTGSAPGAPMEFPASLPARVEQKLDSQSIAWLDPAGFLPPRVEGANAAALYDQAAAAIRKVPGFPSLPRTLQPYLEQPDLREALRLAVDASTLKSADFLALHSYRSWEKGGIPDLTGALTVNRALAACSRLFLEAKEPDKAVQTAQAALSMGEHYLAGAPNLAQALVGESMMEEGMLGLRSTYLRTGDAAKSREAAQRLSRSSPVRDALALKSAAAMIERWGDVSMGLLACSDPDPAVRADSLLLIEACFDPGGLKRMQADKDSSAIAVRLRSQPKACRDAVASRLGDPNPTVRRLAERILPLLDRKP